MALARWQATITDGAGNVVPSATIEVRREESGTLASIYSDRDGATPKANPFTADSEGFAFFHASGDAFRIDATSGAFTRTWRYVAVGTGAEQDFDYDTVLQSITDAVLELASAEAVFPTSTLAEAENIPEDIDVVRTLYYATLDDNGGGIWNRVESEPAHSMWFQSADGAYWELDKDQIIRPEMFGAVGDGVADDIVPFQNCSGWINDVGGGVTVQFRQVIYTVWIDDDTPNFQKAFDITVGDVNFIGNGCNIYATGTHAGVSIFFYLDDAYNIKIDGFNFVGFEQFALEENVTESTGVMFINLVNNVRRIDISNLYLGGCRTGIGGVRSVPGTKGFNVKIWNVTIETSMYGLNFQKNPDQVVAENIRVAGWIGRSYFPYNVTDHKVHITDHAIHTHIPPVLIKLYAHNLEENRENTTSMIDLTYVKRDLGNEVGAMQLFGLAIQQSTSTSTPGFMREIKIHFDIIAPDSTNTAYLVVTDKKDSGGSQDSTTRGHYMENLDFSGRLLGGGQNIGGLDLFNDSDWATETVRNVVIHDFVCDGCGLEAIIFDCDALDGSGGRLGLMNIHTVASAHGGTGADSGKIILTSKDGSDVMSFNVVSPAYSATPTDAE